MYEGKMHTEIAEARKWKIDKGNGYKNEESELNECDPQLAEGQ